MKKAICQVADTGPLESLVEMLSSVGYECYIPNESIKFELRRIGCDTVLDINTHVRDFGYEEPLDLPIADLSLMKSADLFVEIKAQRSAPKIVRRWPNLSGKILWYRINGGEPIIHSKHGDEVNLRVPLLTPNLWYARQGPWSDKTYACWPPFCRIDSYLPIHGRATEYTEYSSPVSLVHNLSGWGYRVIYDELKSLGVKCYGRGSPDGLIRHETIPKLLSQALAMVHLKSNDAPGYALYEGLAAGCPLVVGKKLIWKCCMQDLFIHRETCYVFDDWETHAGWEPKEVEETVDSISEALRSLSSSAENGRIGLAGRKRLEYLMWSRDRDQESLSEFMERHFP